MSCFPNNKATKLTNEIMGLIRDHLKEDEDGRPFHSNRTFEAIHKVLSKEPELAKELEDFFKEKYPTLPPYIHTENPLVDKATVTAS